MRRADLPTSFLCEFLFSVFDFVSPGPILPLAQVFRRRRDVASACACFQARWIHSCKVVARWRTMILACLPYLETQGTALSPLRSIYVSTFSNRLIV